MISSEDSPGNFPIPLDTDAVTVEWISNALDMEIDEKSFVVTGSANVGVGFLSNLIRVKFLEKCRDGKSKEHFLIVKLLPLAESVRQMVTSEKMDKTELYFYKKLVPDLVHEVPSLEPYFCPVIYAEVQEKTDKTDYASVLILKDLNSEGYITKPFSTHELSAEEIDLTIDFFAKFHFAAHLAEVRKKRKLCEVYDFFAEWFYPNENKTKEFLTHKWFKEGFQPTKTAILNYVNNVDPSKKECGMEIIEKMIEPFAPHAQKIFDSIILAGQKYPSVIHADLWQNNILTKSGNKTSIKIIDWQICGYSDTIYDLAIFLTTTLLPNMTMQQTETIARSYYDKLEQLFAGKELGGETILRKRRTWEEFWQTLITFGFTYTYVQWIMFGESLATSPENFPKIFESFRFFHYGAGLTDFLTQLTTMS